VDENRPLELTRQAGVVGRAFVDCGGGGLSDYSIAVGHRERDGTLVVDVLRTVRPSYNPVEVTRDYASLLRSRGLGEVAGDFYGGGWVSDSWRDAGIRYVRCSAVKSEIYLSAVPLFAAGRVRLPNHPRLISQLRLLERRTRASGRDLVEVGKCHSDDCANAVCGLLRELERKRGFLGLDGWRDREPGPPIEGYHVWPRDDPGAVEQWLQAIARWG
jgi:hypothetical protein